MNELLEHVKELARREELTKQARDIAVKEKIRQLRAKAVKNRAKNLFEHK